MEAKPLVLQRFDILKLFTIDTVAQNFRCQFILEFLLPNGISPSTDKEFPVDTNSKSFELSAAWYLSKIEPMGESYEMMDQKIITLGDNAIKIQMRFEGTFTEVFELHDFPFDVQGLQISLAVSLPAEATPAPWALRTSSSASISFSL